METTLIIFKPDAVQRGLMGRFEDKGLQVVGCKLMQISQDLAATHYEAHKERPFYKGLVGFMTSSPVLVLAIRGNNAIAVSRKMMGATFGSNAESGTIRGDFGVSNSCSSRMVKCSTSTVLWRAGFTTCPAASPNNRVGRSVDR